MHSAKSVEIGVGLFMLAAIAALLFISLRVAINHPFQQEANYILHATFDDITGLKVHSPVKIGGVIVGEITKITLDKHHRPFVRLAISQQYRQLPNNSRLASRTAGLLGEKYLAIILPGFTEPEVTYLKAGDTIEDTDSSIVLEELIGRFFYSQKHS